jgi:predicted nucleic acid-binding protein
VGLIDDVGLGPVGLDTALFVYLIEEQPDYLPVIEPLFTAVDTGKLAACTSSLTLLEVLVVPFREGNNALAARYEQILTASRGLMLVDLDRAQLRRAARLKAGYVGLRTPDAIQLGAALTANCTAFVTNDRRMPQVAGLRVIQLADYLGK